jgi:protein-S-isoprenylcysteine O-methyltransferase Ste14
VITGSRKWRFPIAWFFYLVIVFEILYMISPFALYYYSAYGFGLGSLNNFAATSWLTGFFLPHYTETTSALLRLAPPVGWLLTLVGFGTFAVCAGQIYFAKFAKRGAVTGGVYRWIRHPQYTAFSVMGLGVLLIWPRFIVLVTYVVMLFVYYFLARAEEGECVEKFGEPFETYMAATSMFLPGKLALTRHLPSLPDARAARVALGTGLFVAAMALAVGSGVGLRHYSIDTITTHYSKDAATISTALMNSAEVAKAVAIASNHPTVRARLTEAGFGSGARLLNYVVPVNWFLVDLPLEAIPANSAEYGYGHHTPKPIEPYRFKVLFTQARLHDTAASGPDIIKGTFGRTPLIVAKVNTNTGQVTEVLEPIDHVVWGDIPTPLF